MTTTTTLLSRALEALKDIHGAAEGKEAYSAEELGRIVLPILNAATERGIALAGEELGPQVCPRHPHLTLRCHGCIGSTGGTVLSPKKARASRRNGKRNATSSALRTPKGA